MSKFHREIQDPIHGAIPLEAGEMRVVESEPFQRLRHIHQLGMSHLVFPGATHKRFEHSLGVMHLAGRVFDVVTHPDNLDNQAARTAIGANFDRVYWRRVLRLAALVHDVGHLPFSHAAEKELLPVGWDHERLTDLLVLSDQMRRVWQAAEVESRVVAKLALGPDKLGTKAHRREKFTPWEMLLAEVVTGDSFGVDRIDYLLRDARCSGVSFGGIEHEQLINSLRILPDAANEPVLGIEERGLQSVEGLLQGRRAMYYRVYFDPVRKALDHHLVEFLKIIVPQGKFPVSADEHLARTDNEMWAALRAAAKTPGVPGHQHARRILQREHFRLLYSRNSLDVALHPKPGQAVFQEVSRLFGPEGVYYFSVFEKQEIPSFPVRLHDGRVASNSFSERFMALPKWSLEYVLIAPEHLVAAQQWLNDNRDRVLSQHKGGNRD